MSGPIGPVTGEGSLSQWTDSPVHTSGGVLVFDANPLVPATFRATFIPEPGAVGLAVAGLVGIGAVLCRRRGRSSFTVGRCAIGCGLNGRSLEATGPSHHRL